MQILLVNVTLIDRVQPRAVETPREAGWNQDMGADLFDLSFSAFWMGSKASHCRDRAFSMPTRFNHVDKR
jgi:hypothetical protein